MLFVVSFSLNNFFDFFLFILPRMCESVQHLHWKRWKKFMIYWCWIELCKTVFYRRYSVRFVMIQMLFCNSFSFAFFPPSLCFFHFFSSTDLKCFKSHEIGLTVGISAIAIFSRIVAINDSNVCLFFFLFSFLGFVCVFLFWCRSTTWNNWIKMCAAVAVAAFSIYNCWMNGSDICWCAFLASTRISMAHKWRKTNIE